MNAKYTLIIGLIMLAAVLCLSCVSSDHVLDSLPEYNEESFYSSGGFQDYTDYAKYTFDNLTEDILKENWYLDIVTSNDTPTILSFIEDFEGLVQTSVENNSESELVNYDFDRSMVEEGDYFYIESESFSDSSINVYVSYNIYYFDIDRGVLYFFHNNI